jgi:hypothetical protein
MAMIPSIRDVILESADRLELEFGALMVHSKITQRYENIGAGLGIVSLRPFQWAPLPTMARPLQNALGRGYREFAGLVDAMLAHQPSSIREGVSQGRELFLRFVDQDGATTIETVQGHIKVAAKIIETVKRLVSDRAEGDTAECFLIPDTNAFYAQPALELWEFEECPRFTVVLTPAALTELDRHKDHHPNPAVMKKAAKLVRQIGEYRRRGRLVDGVPLNQPRSRLMAWPRDPDMNRSLPWLSRESADDRLLASAIEIARARALSPVAVVTRDLNLQNKCELARMPFLRAPNANPEVSDG